MGFAPETEIVSAGNDLESFTIMQIEAEPPKGNALFAVGRGGPARHRRLLRTVADRGLTVIAPHFEMLASSVPTKAELDIRIRRLNASLKFLTDGLLKMNMSLVASTPLRTSRFGHGTVFSLKGKSTAKPTSSPD